MQERGFLTLVDGTSKWRRGDHYERMAKGLIRNIKQYDPNKFPVAVVTDSQDPELHQLADLIIPVKRAHGMGTIQKLYLDSYSPFKETIFIEPDCLFYTDPAKLWQLMSAEKKPFAVQRQGGHIFRAGEGNFSIIDMAAYLKKCKINSIYHTIGGLIYFQKNAAAGEIFEQARKLYKDRKELGLIRLSNQIEVADETLFATAVEMCGIGTCPCDESLWQEEYRLLKKDHPKLKVLKDETTPVNSNNDTPVLIVHYSATDKFSMLYLRQLAELKLAAQTNYQYGFARKLRMKMFAFGYALPPYLGLKKRWIQFRWRLIHKRYQEGGLYHAMPVKLKKIWRRA